MGAKPAMVSFFLNASDFLNAVNPISNPINNEKNAVTKPDVLASNLDTLVKPSEDFFEYANGGWLKKNPIPADQSGWGIGYVVGEENNKRLRDISDSASKNPGAKGSASQMIGDFWAAAMDSAAVEKEGTQKLQPWFDKINAINNIPSFIDVVTYLNNYRIEPLFSSGVGSITSIT